MGTHIVQPGESLGTIAQTYNTTVQTLVHTNHIRPSNSLLPGTLLTIPEQFLNVHNEDLPLNLSRPRTDPITHVMIHFNSNAAHNPRDPYHLQDIQNRSITNGVSTHYRIGRNGDVFQLVDETRVANQTSKGSLPGFPEYTNRINDVSIGIELMAIGTRDEMLKFMSGQTYDAIPPDKVGYTNAQYRSLNQLLNTLFQRHPTIVRDRRHVVGYDGICPNQKNGSG